MDLTQILQTITKPDALSSRNLKTQAIALLIFSLTKTYSRIINYAGYDEIILNEKQILASRKYLNDVMNSKPGEVRIVGTGSIILPEVLKKYWPYAVGTLIGGYLLGKIF